MMESRGIDAPVESRLPKRGWVIDGIVFAFLAKTDMATGIIEYFVTNDQVPESLRLKACDLLIRTIEDEANRLGMEVLVGSSTIVKVIALAMRSGFTPDPQPYYYVRKLLHKGIETHERRKPIIERVKPKHTDASGTAPE
jgi:hypothetical protein